MLLFTWNEIIYLFFSLVYSNFVVNLSRIPILHDCTEITYL